MSQFRFILGLWKRENKSTLSRRTKKSGQDIKARISCSLSHIHKGQKSNSEDMLRSLHPI